MGYKERKELYEEIESLRGRPLIVYVTSIRSGMGGLMVGDVIRPIIDQLSVIPVDKKEVDFMIISNGGDPIASLRIMSLLRERFNNIAVLIPYVAYSAATILALGADEIIMHPYSNLGPVDPQLNVAHKNAGGIPERLQFSSEDLVNYIEFVRKDIGITDQQHLIEAATPLISDVGALSIGNAKRGQRLSLSLSEKMLGWHLKDTEKIKSISKALNSSYYHHGYAVGRKEAIDIGLTVKNPEESLEKAMWSVWLNFEEEMKCDEEFNPVACIMSDKTAHDYLSTIPSVKIPVGISDDIRNMIMQKVATSVAITNQNPISVDPIIASVESIRMIKTYYNELSIHYWRNSDNSIGYSVTCVKSGWMNYKGEK